MFVLIYILSILVSVLSLFGLVLTPFAETLEQSQHAFDFFFLSIIGLFVSGCVFLALRNFKWRVNQVKIYAIISACWIILPIAACVPFVVAGDMSLVDAYFESVSGFTTTGATVAYSLSELGGMLQLWRAFLQWLGGLFTLLCIVIIMAPSRIGGLPDGFIRLIDIGEGFGDIRLYESVKDITLTYSAFTAACICALFICGMDVKTAICLGFSTLSTGGFVPTDGNISSYNNPFAEVVLILFMVIGGTSILWHRMIIQKRRQFIMEHRESYYLIFSAVIVGFVFSILLVKGTGQVDFISFLTAFREGVFTSVSLITTTGFEVRHNGFAVLPLIVVLILALIGGGTFSTAGGFKHYRIGGMAVQASHELFSLVYPHGVRPSHFGSQLYDFQLMKSIWSFFVVGTLVVGIGTIILSLDIVDFSGALLASVSSFSNIGTVYSSGWMVDTQSEWTSYAQMNSYSKFVLCFLMILGRLEVLVVLGAFSKYLGAR